jgi:hypothetical protein
LPHHGEAALELHWSGAGDTLSKLNNSAIERQDGALCCTGGRLLKMNMPTLISTRAPFFPATGHGLPLGSEQHVPLCVPTSYALFKFA